MGKRSAASGPAEEEEDNTSRKGYARERAPEAGGEAEDAAGETNEREALAPIPLTPTASCSTRRTR